MKEIKDEIRMIRESQIRMEEAVAANADDLKEHMRRTDILEGLHRDNEKRIIKLEGGITLAEFVKKTGAVLGLLTALAYIVDKLM